MARTGAVSTERVERIVRNGALRQRTSGTVRGIDTNGRLVLDGPNGAERVLAGDVTLVHGYRGLATAPQERDE